jgi:hypothetical protein
LEFIVHVRFFFGGVKDGFELEGVKVHKNPQFNLKKGPIILGMYSLMAIMRKETKTRYFRKWNARKQVRVFHFFNAS